MRSSATSAAESASAQARPSATGRFVMRSTSEGDPGSEPELQSADVELDAAALARHHLGAGLAIAKLQPEPGAPAASEPVVEPAADVEPGRAQVVALLGHARDRH